MCFIQVKKVCLPKQPANSISDLGSRDELSEILQVLFISMGCDLSHSLNH